MTEPHTYSLTKAMYERARRMIVYAWLRGDEWLYVGMSTQGLARIYGAHEKINKREPLLDEDELRIWECEDVMHATELERLLIQRHTPKYNHTGNPKVPSRRWTAKRPSKRQRAKLPERGLGLTWTGLRWVMAPVGS